MAVKLRHGIFMAPFHKMNENPTLLFQQDMQLVEILDGLGFHEAWSGEHQVCRIMSSEKVHCSSASVVPSFWFNGPVNSVHTY